SPTIEPNVPGATGARPAPKPSARQCTGSVSAAIGISTGRRSSREVVMASHRAFHRLTATQTTHTGAGDDAADPRDAHAAGGQKGRGVDAARQREQQLIVVAAVECVTLGRLV